MQIAKNGLGFTRPNPSVGAIIVLGDEIIGEGYTSFYGGNHAEVNAINNVKNKDLLSSATLYVTLEPCSHFGKTPPCADLIVKHQFKNVVIGCIDSNSLVAGKGVERLKKAGINVFVGVLEKECLEHHKRFFKTQTSKRPYVILKWAETKNGLIAPLEKEQQEPVWISNKYSQQLVHKWRAKEHAILVGTNTVISDNPKLNVRNWKGNNPVRIVLDRSLRIPENLSVFDGSIRTIVIFDKENTQKKAYKNVIFEQINFSENIAGQICEVLQKHKIQSIIIEGGRQTLQTFINSNIWDEARIFIGDLEFNDGLSAPIIKEKIKEEIKIKNDVLKVLNND